MKKSQEWRKIGGKGEGPNWSVGYNNIRIITTKPALGHTRTIINNNCLNFSHMTKCYYHIGGGGGRGLGDEWGEGDYYHSGIGSLELESWLVGVLILKHVGYCINMMMMVVDGELINWGGIKVTHVLTFNTNGIRYNETYLKYSVNQKV